MWHPACLVVLFLAAACGGEDGTATTSAVEQREENRGHSMGVEAATVADAAGIGPGPSVGDRWEVPIGLSVCGRFVDAPPGDPNDGVASAPGGTAVIEPGAGSEAGHRATIGRYATAAGIELSTGELSLPHDVEPDGIEIGGIELSLGDTTFRTGDECGQVPAEVQIWVYSPEALRSGEGVLVVSENPQDVPFGAEGMAVVIAFAPESSLPTLPPSALVRG
jgi:hypothetical protein